MKELSSEERRERPSEAPPIIIKIGGNALSQNNTIIEDIATLHSDGRPLIVVHGGGPAIDDELRRRRISSKKIDGIRVNDKPTLEAVISALAQVNEQLVKELLAAGVNAFGLTGKEIRLLEAEHNGKLGLVGNIIKVDTNSLNLMLSNGIVPIVSPISYKEMGNQQAQLLNSNADEAAGAIASSFPCSRLVLVTDVPGVLDEDGKLMCNLSFRNFQKLVANGNIKDGMIPKIDACFNALRRGSVPYIVDGRMPHAILQAAEGKIPRTVFFED